MLTTAAATTTTKTVAAAAITTTIDVINIGMIYTATLISHI